MRAYERVQEMPSNDATDDVSSASGLCRVYCMRVTEWNTSRRVVFLTLLVRVCSGKMRFISPSFFFRFFQKAIHPEGRSTNPSSVVYEQHVGKFVSKRSCWL